MNFTLAAIILIIFALVVAWIRIAIGGGSIKKQWWPLVFAAFCGWNVFVPLVIRSATYHGKVVDEETGAPIVGAVVTVLWYDSQIIHMAKTSRFMTADETVTQSDGSFSLWTWPGFSFYPSTYVLTPPDVIVYKAGYAPLNVFTTYDRGYRSSEALADDLKKGIVMRLPKLRTREEALRFAGSGASGDVPFYLTPRLTKEVNIHRKDIGLGQIP